MSLLIHLLLYVVALFLILVVYLGQRHDNAKDTLRAVIPATGKWLIWSVVLVLGMQALFFISAWLG